MEQNQVTRAAQPQRQAAAPQQQRPVQAQQRQMAPQQRAAAPQQRAAAPQQRPAQAPQRQAAPQQRAAMPQQRPAQAAAPQQAVEKQIIVRMFQPDMQLLKATAKQISATPNVKLGLYGQSGEVLVVIAARARTAAAATELTENAAAQFEAAMGDAAYGRGKMPLAAFVAAEMNQDETTLAAADEETGRLLEVELQPVQDSDKVFDFGQNSFRNARMADKIADAALMDDEESSDPIQLSADRSFAAHKCTKSDFGVSIAGTDGGQMVCAAVTYGKTVYVRCIRAAADADKSAALTVLDMIRRLTLGMPVPYARAFKAGQEIDWNEPMQQKAGKAAKSGGKGGKKNLVVPIVLLVLVAAALGVAIWYVVTTFIIQDETSIPAGNSTSVSDSVVPESVPAADVPADAGTGDAGAADAPVDGTASTAEGHAAGGETTDAGATGTTPTGDSVVHPFG